MQLFISGPTEAEVLKLALAKLYIDSKGPTSAIAQKLFARFARCEEQQGKKKALDDRRKEDEGK